MSRVAELQKMIKQADTLHLSSELLDYSGVVAYYPEELVITVKAGTQITAIQKALTKNKQTLPFFIENENTSIGAAFARGAADLSDSVLGVKIIDGTGAYLNFGGQVMKNVAGYDVARLLVGSKGQLALIMQISFKVMPSGWVNRLNKPIQRLGKNVVLLKEITQKLKTVFDPKGIFH